MTLRYEKRRKKRFYHDDHPLTKRQRQREARLRRERRENLEEGAFGKINWNVYTHEQLWDMIKSAKPPAMGERAHQWAQLAANVDSATAEVRKTLQELLLSWRGKSAVQAASSTSQLTAWGSGASQVARHIGEGLDNYTSAVSEAQKKIPEPVHLWTERWFRQGYDIRALDGPNGAYLMDQLLDDHLPTKQESQRSKAEAVRVMDDYETASRHEQLKLPTFKAPPTIGGGPIGPGAGSSSPADTDDDLGPDGLDADETTTAAAVGAMPGVAGTGYGMGSDGYGGPGSGMPGSPGATGYGAGTGGPGTGSGAPGTGNPGSSTGAMVPGGPPAAKGGAATPAGARGGGGPGTFGMYPPMAGTGNKEEDKDHKNRYELGLDLMDDLPPAYPPVFGQ